MTQCMFLSSVSTERGHKRLPLYQFFLRIIFSPQGQFFFFNPVSSHAHIRSVSSSVLSLYKHCVLTLCVIPKNGLIGSEIQRLLPLSIFTLARTRYDLLLTVDDAGLVSVLRQKIKLVILFNPWCIGNGQVGTCIQSGTPWGSICPLFLERALRRLCLWICYNLHPLSSVFCLDDTCHYPNQSDLSEYVLNGSGRIWVGTSTSNYGRPWQFSQFSKDSLEVALWVLDQMKRDERSDPVKVTLKLVPKYLLKMWCSKIIALGSQYIVGQGAIGVVIIIIFAPN